MPEYKIKLTWEAIYDVTDIADYIEAEFGQDRADRFQTDIGNVMDSICSLANDQNINPFTKAAMGGKLRCSPSCCLKPQFQLVESLAPASPACPLKTAG